MDTIPAGLHAMRTSTIPAVARIPQALFQPTHHDHEDYPCRPVCCPLMNPDQLALQQCHACVNTTEYAFVFAGIRTLVGALKKKPEIYKTIVGDKGVPSPQHRLAHV